MVDTCIGPYKILRELAEDRVGRVFEAIDLIRKKLVLIKSLRGEFANNPGVVSRLYSRAEILALLNHEHIARLFGFIRRDDGLYLVMESVEGENLQAFLKEKGRLDFTVALAFFRQILLAVEFAHRLGLVHGELKPANIIVTDFARIKVLDFAIATILGNPDPAGPTRCAAGYMSPEQLQGDPADARSDIYSLGILLYELIVGKSPFQSDTQDARGKERAPSTPLSPSLLVPNIPYWIDAFLLRAMAVSPANRFQSISAMSHAIGRALEAEMRKSCPQRSSFWARYRVKPIAATTIKKPAKQIRGRFTAAFTRTANAVGQKSNSLRRGFQGIDPIGWSKRGASKLRVGPRRILSAMKPIPIRAALALTRTLNLIRQAHVRTAHSISHGAAAVNPAPLIRHLGSELRDWARSAATELKALQMDAQSLYASLKRFINSISENSWKRYVVIAVLVASVMIETFIFGGANIFLNPDYTLVPPTRRNAATQNLANSGAIPVSVAAPDREPEAKMARPTRRRQKTFEKAGASADDLHYQALDSRRTVTYRTPRAEAEQEIQRPSLQELRVSETSRRAENNAQKQLNVKWEN